MHRSLAQESRQKVHLNFKVAHDLSKPRHLPSLARASTPGVKSVVTAIDSHGARPREFLWRPTPVQRGGNAPKRSYSL